MVTVPAMLPIYQRLGMDPLVLTCTTALAAGTMNILPWGGPASRAATVAPGGVGEVFAPLVGPDGRQAWSAVFAFAVLIGYAERRRCARQRGGARRASQEHTVAAARCCARASGWFNAALTRGDAGRARGRGPAAAGRLPDRVRHRARRELPDAHDAARAAEAHGSAAMVMVTTVLAAGLFAGIMTKHRDAHGDGARHRRRCCRPACCEHLPVAARRRLDAAQPGLRSRFVLLRRAARAGDRRRRPPAGRLSMSAVRRCSGR